MFTAALSGQRDDQAFGETERALFWFTWRNRGRALLVDFGLPVTPKEMRMNQYVGLDVSHDNTHICIVSGDGSTAWSGRCASNPKAIATAIASNGRNVARIGLETGPLATWHWHQLNAMGLPVICLDARHAKAALSMQLNKTDKNDAHGIAQIMRTGWYREVLVKSFDSHVLRAMLQNRAQLVRNRVDVSNQIRGTLKTFGIILPRGTGLSFDNRVRRYLDQAKGEPINSIVEALLAVHLSLQQQTKMLDRQLSNVARHNPVVRHLMTIPGVGILTALAFVATIDQPDRFRKSRDVGAYLGLTPRRYESGELSFNGRISKCGDHLLRTYLFEAAGVLLTRTRKWSSLKAWGVRLAKRRGMGKAKVAVARKLAITMHIMWTTGEPFRWSSDTEASPVGFSMNS